MTANTLKSDKELFLNAGMDEFLGKPFSSADLVRVIESVHSKIERINI